MHSLRAAPIAALALAAVVAAACGSGNRPGWTFAPAPSPSAGASVAPSAAASASPAASGGAALEVTAQNITYEEKELTTPADQPFSIHFVNADPAGVPHDIDIHDASGATIQDQDTTDGGSEATYEYEALPAGEYTYMCSVHPIANMTGTLTVE